MKIGELAGRAGVPASTIRYYEKIGLIDSPGRVSGQRNFPDTALQVLQFIQLAQAGGFSLAEIRTIFDGYPGRRLSEQWQVLARRKQAEVRRQIHDLEQVSAVLDALLRCDCRTPAECVSRAGQIGRSG